MKRARRLLTVAIAFGAVSVLHGAEPTPLHVGPNVLVSRDGDVPHAETMVAANPGNPKNLVGASIVFSKGDGGGRNKVYATLDGGSSWTASEFPEESGSGFGGDPQVGFGATGTAYFVGLFVGGGSRNSMSVYRSEDGGVTWGKPVRLKFADHEQLAVDHSTGAYAGRIYLTGEESVKGSTELVDMKMQRRVVLYRSSDDGRSFIGPLEVGRGGTGGLGAVNIVVFSDGMVWIPTLAYPNYAIDKKADTWKVLVSTSTDGGVTLSPSFHSMDVRFGGAEEMQKTRREPRTDSMATPSFAVDASSGKFRDRLYAAWTEPGGGGFRLLFASSGDRGKTWSKPKAVDASPAADASQFQSMIAVNGDGAVGVFWYDTAGSPKRDAYRTYFSASLDGGATFLPKVPVSTGVSRPMGAGNMRPAPIATSERGMEVVDFLSGFSRYPNGGDYIGMAADSDGAFHPFWSDARSGTFQLYSSAIRVGGGEKAATSAPASTTGRVSSSLSGKIALEFDPIRYDAETSEITVPVRLRNTSTETLYPPFRIEIKETAHPYTVKSGSDRADKPVFVNASNGKPGEGAVFESGTDEGAVPLEPGAVTDPVVWRLKVKNVTATDFHVGAEVTGFVAKKASAAAVGATKEETK
jgi:hypothetical protein